MPSQFPVARRHPRTEIDRSCVNDQGVKVIVGQSGATGPAYAARFTFAHLARCAAAILRRADADIVRLPGGALFRRSILEYGNC